MSDAGPDGPDDGPHDGPAFGPSGYLPPRASQRARKIILRAPLGIQWVVAAVVAGIVVLVAALVFFRSSSGPPGPPYEPVGEVAELPDLVVTTIAGEQVAVLTAGGRPRAFAVGAGLQGLRYCPGPNRLMADGDRVWLPTGRGLAATPSLQEHPAVTHEGILYVDVTRAAEGPPPADDPVDLSTCG